MSKEHGTCSKTNANTMVSKMYHLYVQNYDTM